MRIALNSALLCLALATLGGGMVERAHALDQKRSPSAVKKAPKAGATAAKLAATGKKRKVVAAAGGAAVAAAGAHHVGGQKDARALMLQSAAALVVDQSAGDSLYEKNAAAVVPIASITKLMTAMVVLDSAPNLQAPISISDEDVDTLRGSHSRLHVGSVMTRETALLLALMSSENRAAHALARHYPGGMPAFLAAMNHKAQALGMLHTRFEDPTGLTSNNVSTAHDLAKLVVAAHRYPLIREFSTTPDATVDVSGRDKVYRNTNPLVKNRDWDVGVSKTGFIHEAGKCLVMQARVADKPVVIVLLDSAGKLTRVGDANRIKRWIEHAHASGRNATHPTHATVSLPGRG